MILAHDLLTNKKSRKIFASLTPTRRIIDVGCGIRPCPAFPCEEYVCIEPHHEYADVLDQWSLPGAVKRVVRGTAEELRSEKREGSTVFLLDVIEHMEREEGLRVLRLLEEFEHAVVFTPLGWYEQGDENPDAWGYNGGYWQAHRSAWHPEDFSDWSIKTWDVWHPANNVGAILAIR